MSEGPASPSSLGEEATLASAASLLPEIFELWRGVVVTVAEGQPDGVHERSFPLVEGLSLKMSAELINTTEVEGEAGDTVAAEEIRLLELLHRIQSSLQAESGSSEESLVPELLRDSHDLIQQLAESCQSRTRAHSVLSECCLVLIKIIQALQEQLEWQEVTAATMFRSLSQSELEGRIRKQRGTIRKITRERDNLQTKLDRARKKTREVEVQGSREKAKLEGSIARGKHEADSLRKKRRRNKTLIADLQAKLAKSKDLVDDYTQRLEAEQARTERLEEQLAESRKNIASAREATRDDGQKIFSDELTKFREEVGVLLSAQATKISAQDAKISAQATKISAQDAKISAQDAKISAQATKISKLENEVLRIPILETEVEELKEVVSRLSGLSSVLGFGVLQLKVELLSLARTGRIRKQVYECLGHLTEELRVPENATDPESARRTLEATLALFRAIASKVAEVREQGSEWEGYSFGTGNPEALRRDLASHHWTTPHQPEDAPDGTAGFGVGALRSCDGAQPRQQQQLLFAGGASSQTPLWRPPPRQEEAFQPQDEITPAQARAVPPFAWMSARIARHVNFPFGRFVPQDRPADSRSAGALLTGGMGNEEGVGEEEEGEKEEEEIVQYSVLPRGENLDDHRKRE